MFRVLFAIGLQDSTLLLVLLAVIIYDAIESPNSILHPAGAHAPTTLIMMALKLSTCRSAESAGYGTGAGACT